jgi:hypothetical protein
LGTLENSKNKSIVAGSGASLEQNLKFFCSLKRMQPHHELHKNAKAVCDAYSGSTDFGRAQCKDTPSYGSTSKEEPHRLGNKEED